MNLSKTEWRSEFQRRLVDIKSAVALNETISRFVDEFMKDKQGLWGVYQAMDHEIPLAAVIKKNTQCTWAFPRISQKTTMSFWVPGEKGFERGSFDIIEPVKEGARLCAPTEFEGFLIPGLGFDKKGFRLGWGKGFYDIYLSGARGVKVGIAYSMQVVSELARESWDVRMDVLITDQGIVKEF